ncbi:MAG TPA: hypothetical protein VGG63_07125 [Steroidobacteraceae bacterium]|jgi:hypothetical protein
MIAQIWRGRTRADDLTEFTRLLEERVQTQMAAAICLGAYVLQRPLESSQAESLVLTLYDRPSPSAPPISDKEARFLLSCDPAPAGYEVVIDPRRARLYADLRRRFPLRIAALR